MNINSLTLSFHHKTKPRFRGNSCKVKTEDGAKDLFSRSFQQEHQSHIEVAEIGKTLLLQTRQQLAMFQKGHVVSFHQYSAHLYVCIVELLQTASCASY